jgi:hypothetical protein
MSGVSNKKECQEFKEVNECKRHGVWKVTNLSPRTAVGDADSDILFTAQLSFTPFRMIA